MYYEANIVLLYFLIEILDIFLRAPFGESLAPWYFDKTNLTRSLYAKIDEKCVIKSTCLEAIKYN